MKSTRIKVESFDIMQYFYGAVHDPLIRALMRFSGNIDESVLKGAVTFSMDAVPPLRCSFNAQGRRPYWEDRGFTGEDIVRLIKVDADDSGQAEKLLASAIDVEREPQLKIFILRSGDRDTLCVIMSHLVCDGAGFKEYLYLLSSLYKKCANGEATPKLAAGPRGTRRLFRRFGLLQKLSIALCRYDLSKQKQQAAYRLQGDPGNPFIIAHKIGGGDVAGIKEAARAYGATVNDMLLSAYIRALCGKTGERRIVMPCPVDLGKYLEPGGSRGICNLTTNYICDIRVEEEDTFEQTVKQVSSQMRRQKESAACLKSVIELETAFHALPFRTLKKRFGQLFTIPVLSYTNFGVTHKERLSFGAPAADMFLTGAIKHAPYFQLAVSTFDGVMTLSCNMYGTGEDRKTIEDFLNAVHRELTAVN